MNRAEQQIIALSAMQNIVQLAADAVMLALGDVSIQQLQSKMTAHVEADISRTEDQERVAATLLGRMGERSAAHEDLAVVGITTINTHIIAGQTSL